MTCSAATEVQATQAWIRKRAGGASHALRPTPAHDRFRSPSRSITGARSSDTSCGRHRATSPLLVLFGAHRGARSYLSGEERTQTTCGRHIGGWKGGGGSDGLASPTGCGSLFPDARKEDSQLYPAKSAANYLAISASVVSRTSGLECASSPPCWEAVQRHRRAASRSPIRARSVEASREHKEVEPSRPRPQALLVPKHPTEKQNEAVLRIEHTSGEGTAQATCAALVPRVRRSTRGVGSPFWQPPRRFFRSWLSFSLVGGNAPADGDRTAFSYWACSLRKPHRMSPCSSMPLSPHRASRPYDSPRALRSSRTPRALPPTDVALPLATRFCCPQ